MGQQEDKAKCDLLLCYSTSDFLIVEYYTESIFRFRYNKDEIDETANRNSFVICRNSG